MEANAQQGTETRSLAEKAERELMNARAFLALIFGSPTSIPLFLSTIMARRLYLGSKCSLR